MVNDITIGRDDRCDLPVRDETVSSRHAKITREGDKLFITDTNSSNGTKLDGAPLQSGVPAPLNSGAKVIVGRTTLTVRF